MADPRRLVPENVPGEFFVDTTCIDCDTCRQLAPETFGETGDFSFVKVQPRDPVERRAALQALIACPTDNSDSLIRLCIWHDRIVASPPEPQTISSEKSAKRETRRR